MLVQHVTVDRIHRPGLVKVDGSFMACLGPGTFRVIVAFADRDPATAIGHIGQLQAQHRNTVERAFNRLLGYRAVATRCDKREFVYRGTVDVASIGIWLRHPPENDLRDTAQCGRLP